MLMLYKWLNGLFLYQLQPLFFTTREDIFTWLFMQTGFHQWLLNNQPAWFLFDILFYSMPILYLLAFRYKRNASVFIAVVMLVINWSYLQCYTLYPVNSIESYIAWLLFPVIFLPQKEKNFALLFEGLRYFVLFFFVSAAIWKFVQGGIFNITEMSGVLLYQHNQLLTSSPGYWQTNFYLYLISHQFLSYLLYLSATLLEAVFIIGFFTKKYDRILAAAFIIFLVADYVVMRIPYFEISALLLVLLLKSPENKQQRV
ncbi:MAG: hypothetical protein ABI861_02580 [Panacibacter sp.]